jgi:hypothetical protein
VTKCNINFAESAALIACKVAEILQIKIDKPTVKKTYNKRCGHVIIRRSYLLEEGKPTSHISMTCPTKECAKEEALHKNSAVNCAGRLTIIAGSSMVFKSTFYKFFYSAFSHLVLMQTRRRKLINF